MQSKLILSALFLSRAGINCPVIVTGLDSEVAGFLETLDRNLPDTLNVEVSPEISLLSGMDAIEDSIPQDTEMSEVFQIVSNEDMTENHPFLETVQSSISVDETMAVEFEDLMEPLDDSETLKMLDILENQDGAISVAMSVNKESNALPVEVLTALNLSESAAASVCQPEGKGSWFIIADKQTTPDQTDGDCTQITDINVKSQLHIKHLEETEALMMTTLPYPSEEQIGCSQNMHKLVHSDHQNISSRDRPAEKGESILKESSSCEQTIQVAPRTLKNSAQKRKKLTLNDTDPTCSCQFLEGMHQNIHSFEAQTRESDTKDKDDDCSQMGTGLCHFSTTDTNTKVEQVRKSQRIAEKRRRQTTWNSSSDSSYNYISLSKINRRDIFGQTLLHRAAVEDDLDGLRSMIKAGGNVNTLDYAGWTPLHDTSLAGFLGTTNELLKAGAEVNCKGSEKITPLHDAVTGGHYKVAELLLRYGADPLFKNERGKSALEEATDMPMRKLLASFIAKSRRRSASGEKELHTSRSRKIRISCCEKDNMVSQLNSAKQSCDTNDSISEVLQNIEEKQDRLLLFELRSQRDADLYIQDLSQIQNILNTVLDKQKSERDDLAKKYRASAESFKQGALREQVAKLVSRQKSLLLMAQKQKELGQKIQNYKNAKKEASHSAKCVPSTRGSCECNNTEDDPSGRTAPSSDIAIGLENSWVTDNIYLDQESSQYPNRSLNMSGGNEKAKKQKGVGPKKTVSEKKHKEYNIEESTKVTHLKSSNIAFRTFQQLKVLLSIIISQQTTESQHVFSNVSSQQFSNISEDLQMQPELESTHSYLATHQKNIPKNRHSLNANLEPAGIFSHALSQSRISQSSSQCSESQNSEKQLNFKASRRKKNQLLDLLKLGKIKSGDDVLEFTVQDSKHKASLLGNGKVKAGNNSVYQNLVQWIKALLGSDISVSWKYVYNKVTYCGTLLSKIIAEVHVSKEPELTVQQNKLFGRNSTRCNHSQGAQCFSHKAASSQNAENIRQETAPFPQEEMEISLSPETEAEEIMTAVSEIKVPYHLDSSTPPRRFLQFNSRVLIKDEEFMPGHIMDQYWNFYVHCEGFGF
nr:ankyrin repeat domain-containing protein 31 [Zootoca vivipara]